MSTFEDPTTPCVDCGELAYKERCRDCEIDYLLASMECKMCGRMRYSVPKELSGLGTLAGAVWGKRCECSSARRGAEGGKG